MSEIMLTVRDAGRSLHATRHASRADYLVAALSADPETIEELEAALARFVPTESKGFFAGWNSGASDKPWDAGACVIDLASRLVIVDSTYSAPGPRGRVAVTDPQDGECTIPYHLDADWLFSRNLDGWQALAQERRRARLTLAPIDARVVLYGHVCRFIAEACWTAPPAEATEDSALEKAIAAIHASWLLTPHADLGGRAPRDVLLERQGHISQDVEDRSQQWSMQRSCPPGLSRQTAAYRYGGFGTHEFIVYYYLIRFLLNDCWTQRRASNRATPLSGAALTAEAKRLELLRDDWLNTPNFEDFGGETPASIIEPERCRLPLGVSGHGAMIDDDCPLCQMMADEDFGPVFCHYDGCNMDNDFAFSFHATRAEWEAEQRDYEEFSRRCDEERALKADAPASVWQRSFSAPEADSESPGLANFGLGSHLAELTVDLKETGAEQATIDDLNRVFGNLREAARDPSGALIDPVTERMSELLAALAKSHPALADKCADLEAKLAAFSRRLMQEPYGGEDVPF